MCSGPLSLLAGAAFAAWHASGMDAWGDWPGLAWRAGLAALLTASAGPALATGVRYLRLPRGLERALVVLSILLGLWIGYVALARVAAYHAHLMQAFAGRDMSVSFLGQAMSRFFGATVNASTFALIVAGGGLAAVYYLGEQRRINQYAARRDLEAMRAAARCRRPAPGGAAGAGRTAFPVQHTGLGALADRRGTRARGADHRCAGHVPARHPATPAFRRASRMRRSGASSTCAATISS